MLFACWVAMAGSLTVVGWNPCSLRASSRQAEISENFKYTDILMMEGTRLSNQSTTAAETARTRHHWCIRVGWDKATGSNRSAGVEIWINKKSFKEDTLHHYSAGPLPGRALEARFITKKADVTFFVL